MAGHSAWKNIAHRKAAQDAKKGKIFTKIIKDLSVAVKVGGPDPASNSRLRLAMLSARAVNMPKDTMERAIKKASGADSENFMEVTYEAYGPSGVAIFIEATTDNVTRTIGNIRSYFTRAGGSVGKDGCLQFVFDRKGVFVFDKEGLDEEAFTLEAIDLGAEDVVFEEDAVTVTCAMTSFGQLQKAFEEKNYKPREASLQRIPLDFKAVDLETYQVLQKLIDRLEEDDDVQKVYHNIEYNEAFFV